MFDRILDISTKVIAIAVPLLTVLLFLAGRSYVIGWYEAAGVPELAFNWSFADILLIGSLQSLVLSWTLWLFIAILLILVGVVCIPTIGRTWFALSHIGSLRTGESFVSFHKRRRLVRRLRELKESGEDSLAERIQWRLLGKRPSTNVNRASNRVQRRRYPNRLNLIVNTVYAVAFSFIAIIIYLMIVNAIIDARNDGRRFFIDDYVGATGRCPPLTDKARPSPSRAIHCGSEDIDSIGKELNRGKLCTRYRYIHLFGEISFNVGRKKFHDMPGINKTLVKGWLIQNSDKQILIIDTDGVRLLTFGDSVFQWRAVPYAGCLGCPLHSSGFKYSKFY